MPNLGPLSRVDEAVGVRILLFPVALADDEAHAGRRLAEADRGDGPEAVLPGERESRAVLALRPYPDIPPGVIAVVAVIMDGELRAGRAGKRYCKGECDQQRQ